MREKRNRVLTALLLALLLTGCGAESAPAAPASAPPEQAAKAASRPHQGAAALRAGLPPARTAGKEAGAAVRNGRRRLLC